MIKDCYVDFRPNNVNVNISVEDVIALATSEILESADATISVYENTSDRYAKYSANAKIVAFVSVPYEIHLYDISEDITYKELGLLVKELENMSIFENANGKPEVTVHF